MTHRRHLLLAALAAALAPAALRAQDFSKVEYRSTVLSERLVLLQGAGGNIALGHGADATFMVDDDFAPLTAKLQAAVAKVTPKPVQFLLNTHFHFDHTGGNEGFGAAGAVIVAHDNVRRRMSGEQLIAFLGARQPAASKAGLPVVTVPTELRLHLNGEEIHAFHAPRAHTDGDLIVHFTRDGVVHMGDLFFNGIYPFIDASSGGNAEGVIAAADRVLALGDERLRIIPGHGPLADKAALRAYRDMLATVVQRIKEQRRAGKSDAEIAAAAPAAEFDERWGKGFIKADRFVAMMLGVVPR